MLTTIVQQAVQLFIWERILLLVEFTTVFCVLVSKKCKLDLSLINLVIEQILYKSSLKEP